MKKQSIQSQLSIAAVGVLLLIAFLIQFTKNLPWPSELLTALWTVRNGIHLTLILQWCVSLGRRIVSKAVRHMLIGVGCLLAFWLIVRLWKWEYLLSPGDPLGRYCWYGYYVPMVLIPLLGVFIVNHIGKPQGYHCPRWMMLLYVPAALIILGVFTNDLHRLVFAFPEGIEHYNHIYSYGVLYVIPIGWFVLLGFYFVLTMLKKCRVPGNRSFRKLPAVMMAGAMIFWLIYCLGLQDCDMTAINCLIITLMLESAIQGGLIPANSKYHVLFRMSSCPMQIVDEAGQLCYRSDSATALDPQDILDARTGPVCRGDTVLYSKPISGGYVLWQDNVRQVNEMTEKLNSYRAELSQSNQLLKVKLELKENRVKTEEMTRLYDQITHDVAPQLAKVESLLQKAKDGPYDCRSALAEICVISAYIKRRGNLVLLRKQSPMVPLRELEYCLRESLDNLRLSGVYTSLTANIKAEVPLQLVCQVYDLYELVIESLFHHITAVMVCLSDFGSALRLRLQIGCDVPVSHSLLPESLPCAAYLSWEWQDEDIALNLVLPKGGAPL
ncbi:MAG: hypothetical protein IJB11_07225 [Oscillospiraceae bacterium]|nr:hypothetical protein [Oscillospiraceae bacterium]